MEIALVRGPYLRPSGVLPWDYLHENNSDFDVTAFVSEPPRHDTSSLNMPVKSLSWYDGKLSLRGYDHFPFVALRKFDLPRALLGGINDLAEEYDIVHTSENFNVFSAQAARACANRNTYFTFTAGENIPFYPHSYPTSIHKSYVNRHADGATATTIEGKRALIHEDIPHSKIDVVPNAIDVSKFKPESVTADQVGLPSELNDSFTILFVHRLCEQKGTPYLVEAFERFQQEVAEVSLALVGNIALEDESVRQRIERNPDIFHLSYVDHDKISDLYNLADLFVLPSVTMETNEEQFGMALIEAMACGTPSVVTDVGGLPHVAQHGETSLVVEERSVNALYNGFCRLFENDIKREELSKGARNRVKEQYATNIVACKLREFYVNTVGATV